MNGRAALVFSTTVLIILAVICRFRNPVLFPWDPKEDVSLGRAGKGPHKDKMLGTASHDMLFSLLLALALAGISRGPTTFWLIVVLLTGEILHLIFGVRTATFRWLFEGHVQPVMSTEMASAFLTLLAVCGIGYAILHPSKKLP
jgi:hypothetical protein